MTVNRISSRYFGRFVLVLLGLCGVLLSCSSPMEPRESGDPLSPQNLVGAFVGGRVSLTWQAPAFGEFEFYRVYRTTRLDTLGNVDTASMDAEGARRTIDKTTLSFLDVPGLDMVNYYYGVRAVQVRRRLYCGTTPYDPFFPNCPSTEVDTITDTIEGPLSNLVAVSVGTRVRFDILRNVEFAESRQCTLFVYDPDLVLKSVRFTNVVGADTGSAVLPILPRAANADINDVSTISGRFNAVLGTGIYDLDAREVAVPTVPWFGPAGDEPEPVVYPVGTGAVTAIPWTLTRGGGQKQVYGEFTYATGERDTIVDFITAKPHKIEFVLRNSRETRDLRDTTAIIDVTQKKKIAIVNGNSLDYSVKIFGDESIDTQFCTWMVFLDKYTNVDQAKSKGYYKWYFTAPKYESLTGVGDLHNSETVYRFPFAITGDGAREVFGTLAGASQKKYDPSLLVEANGNDSIIASNIRQFDKVTDSDLEKYGRKGFMLLVRFRENAFDDDLVYVLGMQAGADTFWTERDIYTPSVSFQTNRSKNPDHIDNGDTLSAPFNFALDSVSIVDEGYAFILETNLLIARKPDNVDFTDNAVRESISLEQLLSWPHNSFPFPVTNPNYQVLQVRWDNIDPRDWTAGDYLMAVTVKDEYGREGLAKSYKAKQPNPWLVTVKTSN